MTNEELKKYYHEQKIQGRSESQIARSLGMSLAHFMGKLNGVDVDKIDPQKEKKKVYIQPEKIEAPKEEKKPEEDLSWMND